MHTKICAAISFILKKERIKKQKWRIYLLTVAMYLPLYNVFSLICVSLFVGMSVHPIFYESIVLNCNADIERQACLTSSAIKIELEQCVQCIEGPRIKKKVQLVFFFLLLHKKMPGFNPNVLIRDRAVYQALNFNTPYFILFALDINFCPVVWETLIF